ncbi:MAG: hypothetical protein JRN06_07080 [Nitrososphaerota archaeon]|nr:hypothetical protein [Nitrososphaerota archaeon]MDG7024457.1 hypothetical protein [Nitrososphaerota archaeon]
MSTTTLKSPCAHGEDRTAPNHAERCDCGCLQCAAERYRYVLKKFTKWRAKEIDDYQFTTAISNIEFQSKDDASRIIVASGDLFRARAREGEAATELQKVVDYCAWEGQGGVDPQIRLYNLLNGVMPVLYLLNGTDKTPKAHGPTLDTEKNQPDGPST